jgi:tetratricopeptide (TPR) repeat protein
MNALVPTRLPLAPRLRAWLLLAAVMALRPAAEAKVTAHRGELVLPTYPWAAVKHPYLRGTDKVNIYPYPMLDFLSREKTNRTYRTVVLENEYLRITFLPELGGKIHEVLDKTTGQPMFYVNHVIKPGLIGQCGAWTSGGVEWNTGPQGHTVSCMIPVACEILPPARDGSRSVAIGETERIYGTKWTVVVTLRPGRSFIEERVRIYNPTQHVRPYYFWNCTAMPNTPGFRFIYPMTLGTDHGAEKFFDWPIDRGKDLTRGTNYQDASSIFAWHCDQDFFGSYDDLADRGVVSYADHHQLPGKKAWTWGQGGFGRMHQMDLTDDDGPYNEVQTGPLLTQGEVGRLDPCEAVTWPEWWYPVHGIGGFTFANRDLAANAAVEAGRLRLRLLATGHWTPADVRVLKGTTVVARASCKLSPRAPADLGLDLAGANEPLAVEVRGGKELLAAFRVPLDLPARQRPAKKPPPETAAGFCRAGWDDLLFARHTDADSHFGKALEKDPRSAAARTGLALLNLDRDPAAAAKEAEAALAVDPDRGLARLALAVAEYRSGDESAALADAWKAALDPVTAVAGRALVGKLLCRRGDWKGAARALAGSGPWLSDPLCRNRLAFALLRSGAGKLALQMARTNLELDPLDAFARSLLWQAGAEQKSQGLGELVRGDAQALLDLVAEYAELGAPGLALRLLEDFHLRGPADDARQTPIPLYWAAWLADRQGQARAASARLAQARALPPDEVFPHRLETVPVLRWALETHPEDGTAALYLGHLLFSLGRHSEGRKLWERAVQLDTAPTMALRALGQATLNLDADREAAAKLLRRAHELDRREAIVARDLARVLFQQADTSESAEAKNQLAREARDALQAAFPQGKGRSDFVALLARAQNRLGEFAESARMLDSVRVTVWEGAREVHDLFEEAHLALGKAHLEADRAAEALAEFNRALEYPENLATGKLENAREAHVHYLRGNALMALGRTAEARAAWQLAADEPESKNAKTEEARKGAREALERTR